MKKGLIEGIQIHAIHEYPIQHGIRPCEDGFFVCVKLENVKNAGICLFPREQTQYMQSLNMNDAIWLSFPDYTRIGFLYSLKVEGINIRDYIYCFYKDDQFFADEYGTRFTQSKTVTFDEKETVISLVFAYVDRSEYSWIKDQAPNIPMEELIIYGIHPKGFTAHSAAKVKHPGTFLGIIEKLPYLKELGVNALELMPCYEFESEEIVRQEDRISFYSYKDRIPNLKIPLVRTNFWGYKEGLYFAPKASYSFSEDAVYEFKSFVEQMHKNKVEVIMQIFFPSDYLECKMAEVLRFWALNFHVDGFRLIGSNIHNTFFLQDDIISRVKLFVDELDDNDIHYLRTADRNKLVGISDSNEIINFKRFLKGDENVVSAFMKHIYKNTEVGRTVHRISDMWGFTLMDLVSYNQKHNLDNLENNTDGTNENFSWNHGEEGITKKRSINLLRKKQIKNAISLLLLSPGVVYIRGGDEFGFSQKGNNNPYCQDNEISWIDWSLKRKNKEIYKYTRELLLFRNAHKIFHSKEGLRSMDYLGYGYPDVSFHGKEAWVPEISDSDHGIAIMFYERYANVSNPKKSYVYIAYNLYWEEQEFALPRLPKDLGWVIEQETDETFVEILEHEEEKLHIPSRSICILVSKEK